MRPHLLGANEANAINGILSGYYDRAITRIPKTNGLRGRTPRVIGGIDVRIGAREYRSGRYPGIAGELAEPRRRRNPELPVPR